MALSARVALPGVRSSGAPQIVSVPETITKPHGESSGAFPADPWAFYRMFRDKWPDFLRAHFRNSAHVAAFFQVDDKTARDWLSGVTHPRGQVVAYAVAAMPVQAGKLLGAA